MKVYIRTGRAGRFVGLTAALLSLIAGAVLATELTGTPEELKRYLQAETRTVTLNETATETAYTDVATVTLVISSEVGATPRYGNQYIDEIVVSGQTSSSLSVGKSAPRVRAPTFDEVDYAVTVAVIFEIQTGE